MAKLVLQVAVEVETGDEINFAEFNNSLFDHIHKAIDSAKEECIMGVAFASIHQVKREL